MTVRNFQKELHTLVCPGTLAFSTAFSQVWFLFWRSDSKISVYAKSLIEISVLKKPLIVQKLQKLLIIFIDLGFRNPIYLSMQVWVVSLMREPKLWNYKRILDWFHNIFPQTLIVQKNENVHLLCVQIHNQFLFFLYVPAWFLLSEPQNNVSALQKMTRFENNTLMVALKTWSFQKFETALLVSSDLGCPIIISPLLKPKIFQQSVNPALAKNGSSKIFFYFIRCINILIIRKLGKLIL